MGSGREMYAGSGARALPARATSSGSSVSGSKRTIAVGRSGAGDRRHRALRDDDALELGERRGDLADEMVLADVEQPVAAAAPRDCHDAAREERVRRTPEHPRAGSANSASVGASASSRGPSARRYRFHQPLRSLAKWSSPSADHSGWAIDSSTPPAASSASPATRRRRPSRPAAGWCPTACRGGPTRAASRSAAGDRRGAATKSGPLTRTVGAPRHRGERRPARSVAVLRRNGPRGPRGSAAAERRSAGRRSGRPGRRDRDRHGRARIDPVQPAVAELRIDDDAAGHRVRPAAVLVGARPDVGRGRCQLRRLAMCSRRTRALRPPLLDGSRSSTGRRHRATAR